MKLHTRGFTLIEIMVVVSLIAFLSIIITVNMNESRKNARDKTRISDINRVRLALSDYYSVCKRYPTTLDPSANNCQKSGVTLADFIDEVPTDPNSGDAYLYASLNDDCSDYHVGVVFEVEGRIEFDEDHDVDSTSGFTICGGVGFDGTTDETNLVYDFSQYSFQ